MTATLRPLLAVALATVTAACASAGGSPRPITPIDGSFYDNQAIVETGATNAWEALQRLEFSLHARDAGGGITPVSVGRRNRVTFRSTQSTLVVVDGLEIPDLRVLRDIPAHEIRSLRIVPITRALIEYGNEGWNGAIVVETRPKRFR